MQLEFYKFSSEQKAFLLKNLLNIRMRKSFQPTYITYSYDRDAKEHIVTFSAANENALQFIVKKGQQKTTAFTLSSEDSQELREIIYLETILEKKGHLVTPNIPEKLYAELSNLVTEASRP